jgi:uncharacterized protein (DUF1501 family)
MRNARGMKAAKDTVLVVCQLSGGNDGLNTIVPFNDPTYYALRPTLAIAKDKVLQIGEPVGLHPAMTGIAELYKEGKVAVIQNVGYPRPNRSHFKSMEIWQSGGTECPKHGWIGRHFDAQMGSGSLNPVVALGLSTDRPRALEGQKASIPCFASLVDIQNMVGDPDAERMLRQIQGADAPAGSPLRVVQQANKAALDAMSELSKKLSLHAEGNLRERPVRPGLQADRAVGRNVSANPRRLLQRRRIRHARAAGGIARKADGELQQRHARLSARDGVARKGGH